MGGWGSSARRLTSRDECRKYVEQFCDAEEVRAKDVVFYDREFASEEEAEAFATEKDDKWGPAAAVSYFGMPAKLKQTASAKKLDEIRKEKLPSLRKEIENQLKVIEETCKSNEMSLCKCQSCESRVNSKYLGVPGSRTIMEMIKESKAPSFRCPVCGEYGILPTAFKPEVKKLAKIMNKVIEAEEKMQALLIKVESENPKEKFWACSVSINS